VRYAFAFINTSQDGPVVRRPARDGRRLVDGHHCGRMAVPVTDVGLTGEDQGKGGKYLLLPPGYPKQGTQRLLRHTHENLQRVRWSPSHRASAVKAPTPHLDFETALEKETPQRRLEAP
jgi:hypothetical protein